MTDKHILHYLCQPMCMCVHCTSHDRLPVIFIQIWYLIPTPITVSIMWSLSMLQQKDSSTPPPPKKKKTQLQFKTSKNVLI